jgi:hypothetical protein
MTKAMRLRITGGPSVLSIRVEDIETGKLLPVTALTFYRDEQYHVAARVTLLIHEVDINFEGEVEVAEEIQPRGRCPVCASQLTTGHPAHAGPPSLLVSHRPHGRPLRSPRGVKERQRAWFWARLLQYRA